MLRYEFEIMHVNQLKGKKIEGTRDYEVKVEMMNDDNVIFQDTVRVRKTTAGVFPDEDLLSRKIKSASLKKDLIQKLKEFVKKQKK